MHRAGEAIGEQRSWPNFTGNIRFRGLNSFQNMAGVSLMDRAKPGQATGSRGSEATDAHARHCCDLLVAQRRVGEEQPEQKLRGRGQARELLPQLLLALSEDW